MQFQNPFLRGFYGAQDRQQNESLRNLNMVGGLLGLQGQQMQMDLHRQGLLQKQLQQERINQFAASLPEAERTKFLVDPSSYIKQMGESRFSKVDPKDYTAESVARFAETKNYADLVPVRKMEFLNTGPEFTGVNPYTGERGPSVGIGLSPSQRFRQEVEFPWQQGVDRARISNEAAGLNMRGAELGYNTGITGLGAGAGAPRLGPSAPQLPAAAAPAPRPAPQLGVAPPRGAPVAPQPIVPTGATMPGASVPPALSGRLTPKQIAEREANRPQETAALNSVVMNLDASINEADKLLKSEGLSNITGPVMGRTPNVTGSATNAQATLDTLKAQIGVRVLQAMREASKTGGAVGNVTEKEWPILQNQLGALQQSQTTAQFRKNLDDVKKTLEKMRGNATQAFESVYGRAQQTSSDNDPLGLRR